MSVEFSSINQNVMKNTFEWINARKILRDATMSGHQCLADMFPSISNDIENLSREFISAFDSETAAGIRFSRLIDEHIYKQTQSK